MKRSFLIVVAFYVVVGLAGCNEPVRPPPPPQIIDAPRLAEALKSLGGCGVICSFLGATALIIASRRPFKDK
jgi:predicted small lipoprotein YifL